MVGESARRAADRALLGAASGPRPARPASRRARSAGGGLAAAAHGAAVGDTPAWGTGASDGDDYDSSSASALHVLYATGAASSGTARVQPRGGAGRDRSGDELKHPAVAAVDRAGREPAG